jgi:hypothetical protein
LSWFGHINRIPETSIVRKIYKWNPFTSRSRPVGRPKSQWEDDVRNDMRRMKLIKCTEQVQDHPKWKVTVEKVTTLPSCSAEEEAKQLSVSTPFLKKSPFPVINDEHK